MAGVLELPPESRLLVAACLPDRLANDATIARMAAGVDEAKLAAAARHHMVAPLLARRLRRAGAPVPAAIAAAARETALRNLRIEGVLRGLIDEVLEPAGIAYAAVKGIVLAARYHGDVGARACRDLDVLVDPSRYGEVVAALIDRGWRLVSHQVPDRTDAFDALARLTAEVGLLSPDGILVEIHRTLDLRGVNLRPGVQLARAETAELSSGPVRTLSTADHLVYVAYHHSRHGWSRLHWLADLAALTGSPDFDRAVVRARAAEAGLGRLVAAALALPDALAGLLGGHATPGLAGSLAARCWRHAHPEVEAPEVEYHRRLSEGGSTLGRLLGDLRDDMRHQPTAGLALAQLRARFAPTWDEYLRRPLPPELRWVYLPMRVGALIGRLFGGTPLMHRRG